MPFIELADDKQPRRRMLYRRQAKRHHPNGGNGDRVELEKEKNTQKHAGNSECTRKQKTYAHFGVLVTLCESMTCGEPPVLALRAIEKGR
jgi:hypothetical protein